MDEPERYKQHDQELIFDMQNNHEQPHLYSRRYISDVRKMCDEIYINLP